MGAASEKVSELTPAVKLYNEGEYETAIPILWRIYQADRTTRTRARTCCAATTTRGSPSSRTACTRRRSRASRKSSRSIRTTRTPSRHKKFAEHYLKGDLDLMGRIYVRHVQQRP